jgi:hypothetical protein
MSWATSLRSPLAFLGAACFLAFSVLQSPHLVHHVFEAKQSQTDCAFASAGERTQALFADTVTLSLPLRVEAGGSIAAQLAPRCLVLRPTGARAPPPLPS